MHSEIEYRCPRCSKQCAKASTLKRHEYYCRSKPPGPRKSRKKSCGACTRAKTRCDAMFPACSNCKSRGIECQYPDEALPNLGQPSSDFDDSLMFQSSTCNDAIIDTVAEPFSHLPMSNLNETTFNPAMLNSLDWGRNDFILAQESPTADHQLACLQPSTVPSPELPSPTSLQWRPPRTLAPRVMDTPQGSMATVMLAQIIASFPHMMIQEKTFPPFIHPRCYDYTKGSWEISEILRDCMGVAHMFAKRTTESRNILWRAVRMEQEKLLAQYETFSEHQLLAAVQALMIYTTMRLVDGSSEYNDIEVPLLHTLNIISSYLSLRLGGNEFKGALTHEEQHWQQWVFRESRRRVVNIARIMNLAFYMDRALSCQTLEGFSLVPLPAKRSMWEASEEQEWYPPYRDCLGKRALHGLTSSGKLVVLRQTAAGIESREDSWQKWYASQDGFGILVMLASQLLQ